LKENLDECILLFTTMLVDVHLASFKNMFARLTKQKYSYRNNIYLKIIQEKLDNKMNTKFN